MTRERRPPPPLDIDGLERLALRYVERFATTRGKLADYLARKLRERGWAGGEADGPADPAALAQRMADLGYVDDLAYAEAKAAALARRGLGARRVAVAFHQARVGDEDAGRVAPAIADRAIATEKKRRKRERKHKLVAKLLPRKRRENSTVLRSLAITCYRVVAASSLRTPHPAN